MERETGFEPATSTLARLHSTTELLPLAGTSPFLLHLYRSVNSIKKLRQGANISHLKWHCFPQLSLAITY
jgi:hypothetical protein